MLAKPFVKNKDNAEIPRRGDWRRQITAVHVSVATRLKHQGLTDLVRILVHPCAAFHDRIAWQARQAGRNDAKGFAACMYLYGADCPSVLHLPEVLLNMSPA